uniref:Uncharacterized protein n=1 Tax=Branchiostoma floridae TaxID=7739 RepID=C3ZZQ0_BRAFL|eukprot:XP_002585976.1 hypothetical protein BRAFLDRAFT_110315 [Branchiostoma floridae]
MPPLCIAAKRYRFLSAASLDNIICGTSLIGSAVKPASREFVTQNLHYSWGSTDCGCARAEQDRPELTRTGQAWRAHLAAPTGLCTTAGGPIAAGWSGLPVRCVSSGITHGTQIVFCDRCDGIGAQSSVTQIGRDGIPVKQSDI